MFGQQGMHSYPSFTVTQSFEKYQTFLCDFVEIKRNGFQQFAVSLDKLTYGYYKPLLDQMEKQVNQLAGEMSASIKKNYMK
jgi:hypothetical protein